MISGPPPPPDRPGHHQKLAIARLSCKTGSTLQRRHHSYLFTPVVEVSAGLSFPPDFGMTVSFIVVDGMLGL